jgi:acetyltransferase
VPQLISLPQFPAVPVVSMSLQVELLRRLLQVGPQENLDRIGAKILCDNRAMQRVCEKLGFQIYRTEDASVVKAEIVL